MDLTLTPTSEVSSERMKHIATLTTALARFLNDRDRSTYTPDIVLDALLNTFFVAAQAFDVLPMAIESARRNAEVIAEDHGLRPAGASFH
jgi:hypothetical protein